jgi:dTDP-4-amino-4,6-dideoxygalactose transaminase
MEKRINVTRSSMPSLEEYVEELKPVWESRWLSNRGEASHKFEGMLKEYLGVEHVYCFANGHVALEVAIDGLFLPKGGEVITTAYTHCSTTHAIVRNGLVPVFVDVEPRTYTIDPDLIEQAITDKTVAIVATHVYGFPCDVERIEKIAKAHDLVVVYDAAHAFGVKYKGVGIGNFGDLSMFSTHATKVFHTIEGGLVTYKDKDNDRFRPMRKIVNFGFTSHEDIDYVGTNARMNEFEAVMGICNLRHLDEEIAKREAAGDRYWERLEGMPGIILPKPNADTEWNYAYFPVIFDGFRMDRNQVQAKLAEHNIYARKYFFPITNEAKCYIDQYGSANVPIAKKAADTVLTLPMYADLSMDDVDRICDIIIE